MSTETLLTYLFLLVTELKMNKKKRKTTVLCDLVICVMNACQNITQLWIIFKVNFSMRIGMEGTGNE